mgnify:CR=1 FL=1
MNILITKTHITLAKSSTRAIQKTRESKDPPVYPISTSQRKFRCKYVFFSANTYFYQYIQAKNPELLYTKFHFHPSIGLYLLLQQLFLERNLQYGGKN